jgi:hypothetical protein
VATTDCVGNSNTLDAHRAFGTLLVLVSILFLIVALVAWLPNKWDRIVSIVVPILTFLQIVLAAIGGWVAGLHPVNAILVLFLYGWLFHRLRKGEEETPAPVPATG